MPGRPVAGGKKCGAATKKGKGPPCTNAAGMGTDHVGFGQCKLHGGSTPNGKKSAAKKEAEAIMATYGNPIDMDPMDALLQELARTAGHVAWLKLRVEELETEHLHGKVGVEGSGYNEDGIMLEHYARSEPNIWVEMYGRERDRLVKVAKTCIDAGIDERRVKLAESQGQLLAQVITTILTKLGIDVKAESTREAMREGFQVIDGAFLELTP